MNERLETLAKEGGGQLGARHWALQFQKGEFFTIET